MRKIIHVDMDAFFASIEQRDNSFYKGKPVVVGGSPEGRGGVVAAASYEARKFGVRSAMPSKQAKQLCKDLIFIKPRFEVYKQVSAELRDILRRYTDLIEPLSLDEAFLDVTNDKQGIGSALDIARRIKEEVKAELNLTASAGVSVNKFLAKIASDLHKPDGLTFIGPSRIEPFMDALPVEKFFGVGRVTAEKMKSLGLHRGADLRRLSEQDLIRHFGKAGGFYYRIVRGIDDREVQPDRETKSVGAEDTFPVDLSENEAMQYELDKLCKVVSERLLKKNLRGRTVTLKIKFSDFRIMTRSQSFAEPLTDRREITAAAYSLLSDSNLDGRKVRLLGVTVSNFEGVHAVETSPRSPQLNLF